MVGGYSGGHAQGCGEHTYGPHTGGKSMSESNGVIRIGKKGLKKFAFGDGPVFEVDIVVTFQAWVDIDRTFRAEDEEGNSVQDPRMAEYHQAAVEFVQNISTVNGKVTLVTVAEALDFLARLREQYDELAAFFRPRSRDEPASLATSAPALQFSEEPAS